MQPYLSVLPDIPDEALGEPEGGEQASEHDLWFLPVSRLVPDFN